MRLCPNPPPPIFKVYFEREREHEQGRGGGEDPRQTPRCQHRAGRGAQTHKPRDHDLSRNPESDAWPAEPPRRPKFPPFYRDAVPSGVGPVLLISFSLDHVCRDPTSKLRPLSEGLGVRTPACEDQPPQGRRGEGHGFTVLPRAGLSVRWSLLVLHLAVIFATACHTACDPR